jgi:hypothetical protein
MSLGDEPVEIDELEENIGAAALVSRWRLQAARGGSYKFKWRGEPLPPHVHTEDVVEMMGPSFFELRKGDIVCYQQGNELLMRRVWRFVHSEGRNAYVVRGAASQEDAILHNQIVGKVVVVERPHQRHVLDWAWEKKRLRRLGAASPSWLDRAQHHVDSFHFWWDEVRPRFKK